MVGVNNYSTQPAGPSTGSFNGGQTYQNETYIEGLPLTNAGTESDTRNLAFGVSVEAVEQFQIETTGAKAMYEGQGVSNYVLKSGGNQFHGGVYEYFRNTLFDARGFFAPDHARRASERIRRHRERAHQEEQNLLLQQLRRIPLRLGHRSGLSIDSHGRRTDRRLQRVPASDLRSHQRHRDRGPDAVPEQHHSLEPYLSHLAIAGVLSPDPHEWRNPEQLPGRAAATDQ